MYLTFSPALGDLTTLKIPPNASPQFVQFKATFDSHESFLRASSDGVKVEVWTDLPVQGRIAGEWAAFQLTERKLVQEEQSLNSELGFSLLSEADAEELNTHEDNTLYLELRTINSPHVGSRYSFTYRLAYPSGHINWLGTHNSNGEVVVEQGFTGISLAEGWHVRDDGKFELCSSHTSRPLAYLDDSADWSLWVWKSSSGVLQPFTPGDTCEGPALVMLPRPNTNWSNASKPLIMVASNDLSLRVTSNGNISMNASHVAGHTTLGVLESPKDALLQDIVTRSNGLIIPVSNVAVIAFRPSKAVLPFHVFFLPITRTVDRRSAVRFPLQLLLPLMIEALGTKGLVLFSPRLRRVKVVRTPLSQDAGVLFFSPSGDEIIVSPIQIIQNDHRVWRVALLSPCSNVSMKMRTRTNYLPTPPPSPLTHESISASTVAAVQSANSSSNATLTETVSSIPHGGPQRFPHRRRSSLTLVRSLPTHLLRAYLHALFNVVFWFWNVVFKAIVARAVGEAIPRRISAIVGFVLSQTGTGPSITGGNAGNLPAHAQTPLSEDVDEQVFRGDHAIAKSTAVDIVNTLDGRSEPLQAPRPRYFSDTSNESTVFPGILSATLLNKQSTLLSIVQGSDSIQELSASLPENLLPFTSITSLSGDVFLVEFNSVSQEGRLEITLK